MKHKQNKLTEWDEWYYDSDDLCWYYYIESLDLHFSIEDADGKFSDQMKKAAQTHYPYLDRIYKKSKTIIDSLKAHSEEEGKQDWECLYMSIPDPETSVIEAQWCEQNFDIYRLWHVCFSLNNDTYDYVELKYSFV